MERGRGPEGSAGQQISVRRRDDIFCPRHRPRPERQPRSGRAGRRAPRRDRRGPESGENEYWATELEAQRLGAAAWISFAAGKSDDALKLMRAAADLEDSSEKHAVSPGRILPARELLGDMLLEAGRPNEALAAYETSLVNDPKRMRSFRGCRPRGARRGQCRQGALLFRPHDRDGGCRQHPARSGAGAPIPRGQMNRVQRWSGGCQAGAVRRRLPSAVRCSPDATGSLSQSWQVTGLCFWSRPSQ